MDPKDKYYQKTFDKLTKGATVNEMYRKLYELEKQEKYDACAGMLKAIKEFLDLLKTFVNEKNLINISFSPLFYCCPNYK